MAEIEQTKGVQIGVVVPYDIKTKEFGKPHKLWMETDDQEAAELGFSLPEEIARMVAKRITDEIKKNQQNYNPE